jgi:hypothetical protein
MGALQTIGDIIKQSWSSKFNDWLWQDNSWLNKMWEYIGDSYPFMWGNLLGGVKESKESTPDKHILEYALAPWWSACIGTFSNPLAFIGAMMDNCVVGVAKFIQAGFEALGYRSDGPWLNWNKTTKPFDDDRSGSFTFFGKCGHVLGYIIGGALACVTIATYHAAAFGIAVVGSVANPIIGSVLSLAAIITKSVVSLIPYIPSIITTIGLGIPTVAVALIAAPFKLAWDGLKSFGSWLSRCCSSQEPMDPPAAPPSAGSNDGSHGTPGSTATIARSPVGGGVRGLASARTNSTDANPVPPRPVQTSRDYPTIPAAAAASVARPGM